MNIRMIKASESQSSLHESFRDEADLFCVEIANPTPETNKLAAVLDNAFGPESPAYRAYLKSLPSIDPKTRTNVINPKKRAIGDYVMQVTLNGNVHGMFYNSKIKPQVEATVEEFIARSQKKS